ncbi:MAG: hypothetical protein ABI920_08865 [Casimicrobiaceae bacterium]
MIETTPTRANVVNTLGRWIVITTLLHLAWEVVQLRLYTLADSGDLGEIAWAIAHCTAGDAIISAATFGLVAAVFRAWNWPAMAPVAGGALLIVAGVAYTAFSEWRNVYGLGSWAYAQTMPLVFGIGAAPLLQWIIVPLATLLLLRRYPTPRIGTGRRSG